MSERGSWLAYYRVNAPPPPPSLIPRLGSLLVRHENKEQRTDEQPLVMCELSGKLREISRRSQVLFSAAVGTEREDNRGTVWRDRVL